ncbi:NUDIX domain-containing protein [Actinotalea sp. AC32]|nr:NUDIX domain-containing protein [Actinotalea sp. AC32]
MTSAADGEAAGDGAPWELGPDWVVGDDGVPFRRGARVILLDEADRVLLARGHDVDRPERTWWFTVGGGIDAGESAREAAARELLEETGLVIDPESLVGPVLRRRAVFDFWRRTVRQDEEFFLARVERPDAVHHAGWTEVERAFMDEVRWWDLDDLADVREEVFPAGLVGVVRDLLDGWDGVARRLPDGH